MAKSKVEKTKYWSVRLGRSDKEHGERFKKIIDGQTYMNFNVLVCPHMGECEISVESHTNHSAKAKLDMLMYVMYCEIARGYSLGNPEKLPNGQNID